MDENPSNGYTFFAAQYVDYVKTQKWITEMKMDMLAFQYQGEAKSYQLAGRYNVELNPGKPFIEVPYWAMDEFATLLIMQDKYSQMQYYGGSLRMRRYCDPQALPSIYFRVSGHYIEVQPLDYVLINDFGECQLALKQSVNNYWTLGMHALNHYYIAYKMNDNGKDSMTVIPTDHG